MQRLHKQTFSFGDFTLDLRRCCLLRGGAVVKLRPKSFEVLKHLVENNGRLVRKSELLVAIWSGTAVTDDSLVQCLVEVRRALGEEGQHLIKTVPRRGYIFTTEVKENVDLAPPAFLDKEIENLNEAIERDDEGDTSGTAELVAAAPSLQLARTRPARKLPIPALVVLIGMLVLSSAGLLAYTRFNNRSQNPSAPINSIAVLPLRNLSGDPANDYFSDGMTDSLISALSKVEGLTVISRGSVFPFKEKEVDPREVGKRLGVAAVLEGSVMKSGETVRVAVRLVSAADGRVLWSGDVQDRSLQDIFALQNEVARRVVGGLSLKLGGEAEQRLAKRYTENVEAYDAYLKGRYFWNKRNGEGLDKAITCFQQAIQIDPNYALAYAGLADSYILKRIFGLLQPGETPQLMETRAKAAAEQALKIDDTLAEAHTSLGMVKVKTGNDEVGIEREYERAIELNPNYATAHHWYALHLSDMGHFDKAMAELRRAREIDPLSLVINSDLGLLFTSAREYDLAIEQFKKTTDMDPNFPDAHAMLGWTYVRKGMYAEGIEEFEKARALFGGATSQLDGLIYAYGVSGNRSEALKVLGKVESLTKQDHARIPWENWLFIHIGLGDHDKAFGVLEKAHREGLSVRSLLDSPYLDPLRSDPRFPDFVRRVRASVVNRPPDQAARQPRRSGAA